LVSKRTEWERELPGMIAGLIIIGILVLISFGLGLIGFFAMGIGGIIMGLTIGGLLGYAYSALNRRRRYDAVVAIMAIGYIIGAYLIELVFPEGQFFVNLANSNAGASFVLWILGFVFYLVLLAAPFVYAKRTDLK